MANPFSSLASLYGYANRKILRPDGSYGDSPDYSQSMGSDTNGWTGQGALYDTRDSTGQSVDTVDSNSNSYSDSPPPVKPTETEASPTTAQTNPNWASGDRQAGAPSGYTPQAGPVRPLSEGMTPPKEYTDYQAALQNPSLHPKTSAWRQILAGVAGSVASGILSPLGDTIRYGPKGAAAHRDAIEQLQIANESRQAQLALGKEQDTQANQAYLREQQRQQSEVNRDLRQQGINRQIYSDYGRDTDKFQDNIRQSGGTPMPEGVSLESPSTGYVPPPTTPVIPPRQPIMGPVNSNNQPSPSPQAGSDISSLPTRTFNPGAYLTPQMQVPKGYGISMPPARPQMQPSGRVSMIPPRESEGMVIPPPDVLAQIKAKQQGRQMVPITDPQLSKYLGDVTEATVDQIRAAKNDMTRAPTGLAGQYTALQKAWEDLNDLTSPPNVRAAAAQIIQSKQPDYKVVKTKNDMGEDIVSLRPGRMPIPGQPPQPSATAPISSIPTTPSPSPTGQRPPATTPFIPRRIVGGPEDQPAPTIPPRGLPVQNVSGGFRTIQWTPPGKDSAPQSLSFAVDPQVQKIIPELQTAAKEIRVAVEGGTKVQQAINAVLQQRGVGARPRFRQILVKFLDDNELLDNLHPPTMVTKQMAETSRSLLPHIPELRNEIADLDAKGKLGPLKGRFEEFLAGKIGADDPDYIRLRSTLGLFSTGMMKAHMGARGGVEVMHHFANMWNAGKMTAGNLNASLDGAQSFLTTYAKGDKISRDNPNNIPSSNGSKGGSIVDDLLKDYGGGVK